MAKEKKKKVGFMDRYKIQDGPWGSPDEWRGAFFERMGIDKALETLGANDPLAWFDLKANALWSDVVTAYRKAALKYHPDRNGGDDSLMKKTNAAYEVLEARFGK
jgi:hypothetical protein